MREVWKDVEGFEDKYRVSNMGRVMSKKTRNIMKTHILNSGYESASLYVEGKTSNRTVHRLVAYHFCEGYREGLHVNHKDGNRLNNVSTNLEWVTFQENIDDMVRRGKMTTTKAREQLSKVSKKKVNQYTKDGKTLLKSYESQKQASIETGVHVSKISEVCHGNRKSAGGFFWQFDSSVDLNRSTSKK